MSPTLVANSDSDMVAEQPSRSKLRWIGVTLSAAVVVLILGHIGWNLAVAYRVVPEAMRANHLLESNLTNLSFALVGGVIIWKQPAAQA